MPATPTHGLAIVPSEPNPAGPAVFEADPHHQPTPPRGAWAIAITNHDGDVIGFSWYSPKIPREVVEPRAFDFIRQFEYLTRTFGPPRLLP